MRGRSRYKIQGQREGHSSKVFYTSTQCVGGQIINVWATAYHHPPVTRIFSQGVDSMIPGVNVLTSPHRSEHKKPKKPAIVSFSASRVYKLCRHSPSCILPTNHTSTMPTSFYSLDHQRPQTLQIQLRETRIQEGSPLRDR